MNLYRIKGLIIRTVDVREADRMITVFSDEMGVISAMAKGARSLKSRQMSATMQYCYSSLVLVKKGEYYWVREADLIESFFDIRRSVSGLALAAYICEVLSYVTTAEPDRELLRLSLNSLYAIAEGKHAVQKIKAAFEIRCAAALGFMPDVLGCRVCESQRGEFFLDVMDGSLLCYACRDTLAAELAPAEEDRRENRIVVILTEGAKFAFEYCIFCPVEKIFSFQLPTQDMQVFAKGAQTYLLNHLERSFKTLDFYHACQS